MIINESIPQGDRTLTHIPNIKAPTNKTNVHRPEGINSNMI